jgi:hypothetical protein
MDERIAALEAQINSMKAEIESLMGQNMAFTAALALLRMQPDPGSTRKALREAVDQLDRTSRDEEPPPERTKWAKVTLSILMNALPR